MRPVKPWHLVGVVVIVALLTLILVRQFYSSLPLVPWTAIPTLLLLAIGELITGNSTKARIERRPDTKPVEPLAVVRLTALAKASAYGGALIAGVFAGFALHTVQLLSQDTPRGEFFVTAGSFAASVVLICAALYLEHCCKVPKQPGEERGQV
ncbi:DUF3180 domain-containing protein [Nonomuraea soli]|uniref:DMSO reductase anchor subunit n=1 Tax=Nonomuraea soli TaxID=1032476 RepID=A0A7W0HQP3_9ACTN|nr:DUF3180 domain-containing protein [Nonomuraea soli]MBA2892164.1 DMSO reductase anchor subunit [Nonomuraea soli]